MPSVTDSQPPESLRLRDTNPLDMITDLSQDEVMSLAKATRRTEDRFDVQSADGTSLAVWANGEGSPLVVVHGALNDHTTDGPFLAELGSDLTTFAMDRRGRGASGDAPHYAIEREFEDVAAVVDAVAVRTGENVAVWGHSYGADCTMGAATLTDNISHLVLYEPGLGFTCSMAAIEAVETAVTAGDMAGGLVAALSGIVELTEEEIAFVRSSPGWQARLAAVPVLPREVRAEVGWVYQPGQFDAITAPTLLLAGADSPAAQTEATHRAATAIPNSAIHVLDGHSHIAHRIDPAMVSAIVAEFLAS